MIHTWKPSPAPLPIPPSQNGKGGVTKKTGGGRDERPYFLQFFDIFLDRPVNKELFSLDTNPVSNL